MAKYSEQDRRTLIGWFPSLQGDSNFEITSDCTPAYNCIGWALGMNDVWVGLDHPSNYSWTWWPKEVSCNEEKSSLIISLFEQFRLHTGIKKTLPERSGYQLYWVVKNTMNGTKCRQSLLISTSLNSPVNLSVEARVCYS